MLAAIFARGAKAVAQDFGVERTVLYRWIHADPERHAQWVADNPMRLGYRGRPGKPLRAWKNEELRRRAAERRSAAPAIEDLL